MVFNTNILAGSSGQGEDALTVTKARAYPQQSGGISFVQIWTHNGVSSPDTLLQSSVTVSTNGSGTGTVQEYTFGTDPVVTGESKIWIIVRQSTDRNFSRDNTPQGQLIGGGFRSTDGDATALRLNNVNSTPSTVINPKVNLDLSDGRTSIGQPSGTQPIGIGGGSSPNFSPFMGGLVSIA
jgi:hypothetical protein